MTYIGPSCEDTIVRIAMPGWSTIVPGLVVNAGMGDFRGRYTLTHAASGMNFNRSWLTVREARDAAERLADLCDWTQEPKGMVDWGVVKALLDQIQFA